MLSSLSGFVYCISIGDLIEFLKSRSIILSIARVPKAFESPKQFPLEVAMTYNYKFLFATTLYHTNSIDEFHVKRVL